jgi:GMP synthase (glutamine-hydrolysing)
VKGFVLSGGPNSVYEAGAPTLNKEILSLNLPILGICYGMQLLAHPFGWNVVSHDQKEYGLTTDIHIHHQNPLTQDLPDDFKVFMSHGDQVKKLPKDFISLSSSSSTDHVMMMHETKPHLWYPVSP